MKIISAPHQQTQAYEVTQGGHAEP